MVEASETPDLHETADLDSPFYAAGVSMGLLGVIISVTFQCVDTFNIEGSEITQKYSESSYELFEEEGGDKPTLRDFFLQTEYGRCILWPQKGIEKIVMWQAKQTVGPPQSTVPQALQRVRRDPRHHDTRQYSSGLIVQGA